MCWISHHIMEIKKNSSRGRIFPKSEGAYPMDKTPIVPQNQQISQVDPWLEHNPKPPRGELFHIWSTEYICTFIYEVFIQLKKKKVFIDTIRPILRVTYNYDLSLAKVPVRCIGRNKNLNTSTNHPWWHLFVPLSTNTVTFYPGDELHD
jgi:hypothetical protein